MTSLTLVGLCTVLSGACGDDPVSVSAPIGINLKAEEGDVSDSGVISIDKSITTESGNPWGAFIADAQAELGADPGDIELDGLELTLAASSEGVAALGEILEGTVDVQFEMNDTNNVFAVASATVGADESGRTIELDTSFDFAGVQAVDLDKLMGGSFKVVLAGPADPGFKALKAKANLQLTFEFSAYE
jgi:hypothetical protein